MPGPYSKALRMLKTAAPIGGSLRGNGYVGLEDRQRAVYERPRPPAPVVEQTSKAWTGPITRYTPPKKTLSPIGEFANQTGSKAYSQDQWSNPKSFANTQQDFWKSKRQDLSAAKNLSPEYASRFMQTLTPDIIGGMAGTNGHDQAAFKQEALKQSQLNQTRAANGQPSSGFVPSEEFKSTWNSLTPEEQMYYKPYFENANNTQVPAQPRFDFDQTQPTAIG